MRRRSNLVLLAVVMGVVLLVIGCGKDDGPATPGQSGSGIIVAGATPKSLNAPWTLSGPGGYRTTGGGSDDQPLTNMTPGEYTLAWGSVPGWINPSNSTQTLVAGATLTFNGTYLKDAGAAEGFIQIPPAEISVPITFTMGSTVWDDETPHQVTLSGRFLMSETEVTNGQYIAALQWAFDQGHVTATSDLVRDAMDNSTVELLYLFYRDAQISFNESDNLFSTTEPDRPVVKVTWAGAAAYCDWLSLIEDLPRAYDHDTWSCNGDDPYNAGGYRLPTEAEWELACRAGTITTFSTGYCLDAGTEANYNGNFPYDAAPLDNCDNGPNISLADNVGSYLPNDWGLFDMHGNVWEWCNDWYDFYDGDITDPTGAGPASRYRVLRGGHWVSYADFCRSANRSYSYPISTINHYGFRPVRSTN